MERLDWTKKENQAKAVILVKDACELLGGDPAAIKALLSAPLIMQLNAHETGCQLTLLLSDDADEHQIIVAWTGSVWYNPGYEFNDRNKIFGLAPDVPFVAGAVTGFFNGVADLIDSNLKAKADAEAAANNTQKETRDQAITFYATQFPATAPDAQVEKAFQAFGQPRITEAAPE